MRANGRAPNSQDRGPWEEEPGQELKPDRYDLEKVKDRQCRESRPESSIC